MATDVDESFLEEFEVYESQIIRLQAIIRGALVRKWIHRIKQEYIEVFREIEQSDKNTVTWSYDTVCYPCIQKFKNQVPKSSRRSSHDTQTSSQNSSKVTDNLSEVEQQNNEPKTHGQLLKSGSSSPRSDLSGALLDYEVPINKTSSPKPEPSTCVELESLSKPEQDIHQTTVLKSEKCSESECQVQDLEIKDNCSTAVRNGSQRNLPSHDEFLSQTGVKNNSEGEFLLCSVETQTSCASDYFDLHKDKLDQGILQNGRQHKVTNDMDHQTKWVEDVGKLEKEDKSSIPVVNVPGKITHQVDDRQEKIRNSQGKPDFVVKTPGKSEFSTVTNVTSLWDSVSSFQDSGHENQGEDYPNDRDSLQEMRKNIAMELLWVQQAINSRKNYLKLKDQMELATVTRS